MLLQNTKVPEKFILVLLVPVTVADEYAEVVKPNETVPFQN